MSDTDLQLLARYSHQHAEDAFSEIVRRHLNLVYSAALRQVRSPQLAEEVAQSVFTDLARNAAKLKPDTFLTAWLYQVTRCTAIDAIRREARRQLREQIATEMNAMNATADDWTHIEPLLDEAMHAQANGVSEFASPSGGLIGRKLCSIWNPVRTVPSAERPTFYHVRERSVPRSFVPCQWQCAPYDPGGA